jgi:hypothetical protein
MPISQQIFILWVLLPPIFLVCLALSFAAPLLWGEKGADAEAARAKAPNRLGARMETRS